MAHDHYPLYARWLIARRTLDEHRRKARALARQRENDLSEDVDEAEKKTL